MSEGLAERFASRLQLLEQSRDPELLVDLFSEDAELRRLPQRHAYHGLDGARAFWREYLGSFDEVRTDFDALTERDGRAVLEWHSICTLHDGSQIQYEGCTVIEAEGDRVATLRTYYDSAAVLGRAPARSPA
jgi:limonene-1,2-epoxide hydrolase